MNTYIEQILKSHFIFALKSLTADCQETILLKKDNNKAHDTYSMKNKMQIYKKRQNIKTYINFSVSLNLSIKTIIKSV